MADISLTANMRSNLLSLKDTNKLIARTEGRLSSGRKINDILDGPTVYFKAKGIFDHAEDMDSYKSDIDQSISIIKGTVNAIESATTIVEQIAGLAEEARNASTTEKATLESKARLLTTELNNLLRDSHINGVNLLYDTSLNIYATELTVNFSDDTSITVSGNNTTSAAIGITDNSLTFDATNIQSTIAFIESALDRLDSRGSTFATDAALLKTRLSYTEDFVNTLEEAGDKLVLADLEEESANLLALQTRQQLGLQSISFAASSEQSILSLFG